MRYKKIKREDSGDADGGKRKRKFNFLLLGKLALSFVVIFGIYQAGCMYEFKPIVPIYLGALTVLITAYLILNRGIDRDTPTPEMLPDDWDDQRKLKFIESDRVGKRRAKRLLIFIIPMILTLLIDIIYLYYFADLN